MIVSTFSIGWNGDHIVADRSYGGVHRSDDIVIVEITLNAGRTLEVKKNLYAEIAARLETVGVRSDDVIVSLVEVTKENWSFGGGGPPTPENRFQPHSLARMRRRLGLLWAPA